MPQFNSQKTAFHRRIHAEKRHDQYLKLRDWLKTIEGGGILPRLAWRVAALQFPRKDGGPHEVEITPEIAAILKDMKSRASQQAIQAQSPPKTPSRKTSPARNGEPFLDGSLGLNRRISEPEGPAIPDDSSCGEFYYRANKPPIPANSSAWSDLWDNLAVQVEPNRSASALQVVQWVFDNAGVGPEHIQPEDVPSHGALRYLRWVQSSDANYAEFVKSNWSKTIPDKRTLEWERKFNDDGRERLTKIEEFERSLALEDTDATSSQESSV